MLAKQLNSNEKGVEIENWIWKVEKIENQQGNVLIFTNEKSNPLIKSFYIAYDKQTKQTNLNYVCTDEGKKEIVGMGKDTFSTNLEDSIGSFKEYTATGYQKVQETIFAIDKIYYILREHKELMCKIFGFPPQNMFHNSSNAGKVAVYFANKYGFERGYAYAVKELERTNDESSCMDILAKHSISFEEKIRARNVHRYGEHSLFWQAAKKVISNNINADNVPMEVSEVLNVAKKFA